MLLYVLNRPEFIADAYTRRLVFRLGIFNYPPDYRAVKSVFEKKLSGGAPVFRQLHALIVMHAKKHCRKTPVCRGCPFRISQECFWKGKD